MISPYIMVHWDLLHNGPLGSGRLDSLDGVDLLGFLNNSSRFPRRVFVPIHVILKVNKQEILDGFSLANSRSFAKLYPAKLSRYTV